MRDREPRHVPARLARHHVWSAFGPRAARLASLGAISAAPVILFEFKYGGPGFGKGGSGTLKVDGKEVASKKVPHTIPFLLTIDETFDVGVDSRTPVEDKDYKVPFRFNGKLSKVTIELK